ncbi:MAG: hypothetical protein FWD52_04705 [Candidatus Bathyarchaeota archaeon]|nr:hypothetical protein [Candidatus Termiticorpusculum sp.]
MFEGLPFELQQRISDISKYEVEVQIVKPSAEHLQIHKRVPFRYSVTDLLGCVRKAYYKRYMPKALTEQSIYNFSRGKLFDAALTTCFKDNQQPVLYQCKKSPCQVSGRYDFITSEGVMTDLKTTDKDLASISEPMWEYKMQVRFYADLKGCSQAQIMYVNMQGIRVLPVTVGDCLDVYNFFEQQACLLFEAEQQKMVPQQQKDNFCVWCEYSLECGEAP